MTNRLELAAKRLAPWLTELRETLARLDCMGHFMTGSGSAYVGVLRSAKQAQSNAKLLSGMNLAGMNLGKVYATFKLLTARLASKERSTMEITEVRIKLMEEPGERLKAFCSITFDGCFVVRDLKIIEGTSGPFVAMPSRKLTSHCPRCRTKKPLTGAALQSMWRRALLLPIGCPTTPTDGPSCMRTSRTRSIRPAER